MNMNDSGNNSHDVNTINLVENVSEAYQDEICTSFTCLLYTYDLIVNRGLPTFSTAQYFSP